MKTALTKMNTMAKFTQLVALLLCFLTGHTLAAERTLSGVERQLVKQISTSQKQLAATEQQILKQRQKYANDILSLENQVRELSEQTAVARRLADEKTLSLSQLEQRLASWQQQEDFQNNLVARFNKLHQATTVLDNAPNRSANTADTGLANQMKKLVAITEQLTRQVQPSWREQSVILASGELVHLPVLSLGPVSWYWLANEQRAGFASRTDDGHFQHEYLLPASDSQGIGALATLGKGELVFDPTLSRVVARQQGSESLLEHVAKGGIWTLPICLFALFALTIALTKAIQLWRLPKILRFTPNALASYLEAPRLSDIKLAAGKQQRILDIAINTPSAKQRDDLLFMQLQEDRHQLERWLGAIAITAAVSPLLGLLGTVSGMIETFKMMTIFGSGDPEVVSGGIAQALVTTELGLVVAIPALLLNALLSRSAKNYYHELENFAVLVSKCELAEFTDSDTNQQATSAAAEPEPESFAELPLAAQRARA